MSNILRPIDLADHAIRRAVFAVLDGLSAEHRANRKGSERLRTDAQGDARTDARATHHFGVCAQIIGAESQVLHRRCSD
jgi:hypothetical protein